MAIAQPVLKSKTTQETPQKTISTSNRIVGTEKTPLFVKVTPLEKTIEDVEKEEYERSEKRTLDRDITYFTKVTAFATIALLVVAALQAFLFLRQLRMMKDALIDSSRTTSAAEMTVNANIESTIEELTLHGLRRSFKSLTEWLEVPAGIVAQIMGHKPSATAEKHYTVRPLDLLRMHHEKIEAWILDQSKIGLPLKGKTSHIRLIKST